jgi:TusA-related sulfurtransferase
MKTKKEIQTMSNSELKLYITNLTNEFESIKNVIKDKCKELVELEKEYNNINNEIKTRKTIY